MARPPVRRERRVPYSLSLALTLLLFGALTVAFVLIVLPRRFVLQGDLRASGVSFPAATVGFGQEEMEVREPRPLPPPPQPVPSGPRERFWEEIIPLLASEQYEAALPRFAGYLAEYPEDMGIRMEQGVTLVRAGRPAEAVDAFRQVALATGSPNAFLELSRALARQGRNEEAIEVLRLATERNPASGPLHLELAEARSALQASLEEGSRLAALREPPPEPEGAEGDPEPSDDPEADTLDEARAALASGDHETARRIFLALTTERPQDSELLLEWANALQYRLEDPYGARVALGRWAQLAEPAPADRVRLAQLHIWTGNEGDATAELLAALQADPYQALGWALLGDVRRWAGDRVEAARAYGRALALEPTEVTAETGLTLLGGDVERAVLLADPPLAGPTIRYFRDSDGFERLELVGEGTFRGFPNILSFSGGSRRIHGLRLDGAPGASAGGFLEGTLARWWREGTFRAAVTAGADRMPGYGTRPVLGFRVQHWNAGGWNLDASFRHAPAQFLTSTLESVDASVTADRLTVNLFRRLPASWELAGGAETARFTGSGPATWRVGTGVTLGRGITPWFRVGLVSRLLAYTDAAPIPEGRRLFWDPEQFWSQGILAELRLPQTAAGWSAFARATPGMAWVRERDAVRQRVGALELEGGIRFDRARGSAYIDLFYNRGRDGGYTARGAALGIQVRH